MTKLSLIAATLITITACTKSFGPVVKQVSYDATTNELIVYQGDLNLAMEPLDAFTAGWWSDRPTYRIKLEPDPLNYKK